MSSIPLLLDAQGRNDYFNCDEFVTVLSANIFVMISVPILIFVLFSVVILFLYTNMGYSAVMWPPQTTPKFCIQGFSRTRNSIKEVSCTDHLRFPRYLQSKSLNSHRRNVKKILFFSWSKSIQYWKVKLGKGRLDGFRSVAQPYFTEKNYVSFVNFRFFQVKLG